MFGQWVVKDIEENLKIVFEIIGFFVVFEIKN